MVLDKPDTQNYPISQIPKNKNIALVGFESYSYYDNKQIFDFWEENPKPNRVFVGNTSRGSETAYYRYAYPVKNTNLLNNFGIGKVISDYPVKRIKENSLSFSIKYESLKTEYLNLSKQTNFPDEKYFKNEKGEFYEREIDYYVVAINHSIYQNSDALGILTLALTYNFSILTISLVPLIDHQRSSTKFIVFDKNLQMLDNFEAKQRYFVIHSIWEKENYECKKFETLSNPTFRGQMQPACVWEKNILEGRQRISKLLESYK